MINPSLRSYSVVSDYVKDSFADFNVHYFAMVSVHPDGRFHALTSDPRWAIDHTITNKQPPGGLLNFNEINNKQLVFSTENYDHGMGWPKGTHLEARERYGIKNLLSVMIKNNDRVDQYLIDIHHPNAADIYLNRLPLIERIFKSITHQFNALIDDIQKTPLIADEKFIVMRQLKEKKRLLGIQEHMLYHKGQLVSLTPREHECLEALAKGARVKDIARKLELSTRTVETYINRLKYKLDTYTISDLTSCYWNNREFTID